MNYYGVVKTLQKLEYIRASLEASKAANPIRELCRQCLLISIREAGKGSTMGSLIVWDPKDIPLDRLREELIGLDFHDVLCLTDPPKTKLYIQFSWGPVTKK